MGLLSYIMESLLIEGHSKFLNKEEIRELIKSSKYKDIFRDEDDPEYTPENKGTKTTLVVKSKNENILNLNWAMSKLGFGKLEEIVQDLIFNSIYNPGAKKAADITFEEDLKHNNAYFSLNNGMVLKCHFSGQTYNEKGGARGGKGNGGLGFEGYLMENIDKLKELCIGVASKAGINGYIETIQESDPVHVGSRNSKLGAISADFFNRFNPNEMSTHAEKVAYIQIGGANISIKKEAGTITMWNGSIKYEKNTQNDYVEEFKDFDVDGETLKYAKQALEFMDFFIKDDDIREKIITGIKTYYGQGILSKEEWDELKKENKRNGLGGGKGGRIKLRPSQVDLENVKNLLRFSWKEDLFIVAGIPGKSIHGFYVDDKSIKSLIDCTDFELELPYTTKSIGLCFKVGNIQYRLCARDRVGKRILNVPELVISGGLTGKMMENLGLTGYTEIKM